MADAASLAVGLLGKRSYAEAHRFCRDHPETLGEDVDRALAELERELDREANMGDRDAVRVARATLDRCRRDGLELGFASAELEYAQRHLDGAGDTERARRLSQVGKAWHGRFHVTGDRADLDHAVDFARQAAQAAPGDYAALADLAGVMELRYRRFHEMGDLYQTAEHQQAAARAGRNAPDRDRYQLQVLLAVRLTLLAGTLRQLGVLDEPTAMRLMTEAVGGAKAGLGLAEPDSRQRFEALVALVDALRLRYETFGSLSDLDTAVTACGEIASGWMGTPEAVSARQHLARALEERSRRGSSPADLLRAVNELSAWLAFTPLGAPGRSEAVNDLEVWQKRLASEGERR
jgi:hypothetical protein